jgi:hypothetical protein
MFEGSNLPHLGALHGPGSLPGWTFVLLDFDIMRHHMQREHAQIMKITNVFLSNFNLCSNQSNHRTDIDCLSVQQAFNVLISEKFPHYDDTFSSLLCHSNFSSAASDLENKLKELKQSGQHINRSFSIFVLKLKYFKNKSLFSSPTVLKTILLLQELFSQPNALNCFIVFFIQFQPLLKPI